MQSGRARRGPTDSRIDIGAYEYVPPLLGDIDGDGTVNMVDLLILAQGWGLATGQPNFDPDCDLNADGAVDVIDLLILADNWPSP